MALVATLLPGTSHPASAQEQHVPFLTTHDLHGALTPRVYDWSGGRPVGGVAVLKTMMDAAEAECGCVTFRLDGGDQMQGTLESNLVLGASAVAAFNMLRLDAAAVGNHDLDWGVATLRERQSAANYAWLAANVRVRATGARPDWAPPYAIIDRNGVRLGVIGWAPSTTGEVLTTATGAPFEFQESVSSIRDVLEQVRAQNPDFVAIVAHANGDCEGGCGGEMVSLAESLEPGSVDLIVGGHRHVPGYGVVNGIQLLRAGSNGRGLGVIDFFRTVSGRKRFTVRVDTAFSDVIAPDPQVTAALAADLARADSLSRRPIATLAGPMARGGTEYGLGRLVADAVRATAGTQVALSNRGGVRNGLPGGVITYGDLFLVKPFGNTVYRFELTGQQLYEVIEHAVRGGSPEFLSGIRMRYDGSEPSGERVESIELTDGTPVVDSGRYTFASSDFLGGRGDGFAMLEAIEPERLGITVLDTLIARIQSLPEPVVAPEDQRTLPLG